MAQVVTGVCTISIRALERAVGQLATCADAATPLDGELPRLGSVTAEQLTLLRAVLSQMGIIANSGFRVYFAGNWATNQYPSTAIPVVPTALVLTSDWAVATTSTCTTTAAHAEELMGEGAMDVDLASPDVEHQQHSPAPASVSTELLSHISAGCCATRDLDTKPSCPSWPAPPADGGVWPHFVHAVQVPTGAAVPPVEVMMRPVEAAYQNAVD